MSDARLFAAATIFVGAITAIVLTIAWDDGISMTEMAVPWLRMAGVIYGAIFALPLILASLKVMPRRAAALVGVVALAGIYAALLYPGQTGPIDCPSNHCPDTGSPEDLAIRARRAAPNPTEAVAGFAICFAAGAVAHGLAWLGSKLARS